MNTTLDGGIPVLTEIIHAPHEKAAEAAPADIAPAAPKCEADMLQDQALATWGDRDWDVLHQKLSERILRQLQGRIDFVLEQRVRDSLADVLQVAMSGLTQEIKRGLQQTMKEVIGLAVTQEITRLQALKK
jgi:hypothetical protein